LKENEILNNIFETKEKRYLKNEGKIKNYKQQIPNINNHFNNEILDDKNLNLQVHANREDSNEIYINKRNENIQNICCGYKLHINPDLNLSKCRNYSYNSSHENKFCKILKNKNNNHHEFNLDNKDQLCKNDCKKFNYIAFNFYDNIKEENSSTFNKCQNKRLKSKSLNFGNKLVVCESNFENEVTRKISDILYNYILKLECKNLISNRRSLEKDKEINQHEKIVNSKFPDTKDNDNFIGPNPILRNIKKKFAFNKSYDSLDVQSEFFISYLREDDLGSAISESFKISENNVKFKETEENNKKFDIFQNDKKVGNNLFNKNTFQEKVYLNLNKKYCKKTNSNKNHFESNNKLVNLSKILDNQQNKKVENLDSLKNENQKETNKCGFFKCRKNNTYNKQIHLNTLNNYNINKDKSGKKPEANLNSYYSTLNITKRSTNHSFKSIKLNDSLTKFRKKKLSICNTGKDYKCPSKSSNNNLIEVTKVNSNISNNKKDKKVNCRCEIF